MKTLKFFAVLLLIGCQKPKPEKADVSSNLTKKTEAQTITEKLLKTDTISISDGEDSSSKNYILANLISKEADKDSIVTANFRLDLYQNKIKTNSTKVSIKGFDKRSYWSGNYGLASEGIKTSPFIQLSCGVEACGYAQNHFLFYFKNNKLNLVYQWDTFSDSGYGSWIEFTPKTESLDSKSFYCKTVAFEPTDDDTEDYGILKYSDSTLFELKNNSWTKQLLSVKDKAYFEKKLSFEELGNRK